MAHLSLTADRNVTHYTYDGQNNLLTATDQAGTTSYTHDAMGNVLSLTDADANVAKWTYDGLGRVTTETYPFDPLNPSDHTTSYQYDLSGNLIEKTDRDGRVTEYTYDARNRLTEEQWYSAGSTLTDTLTYTYDDNDNLLTAADYDEVLDVYTSSYTYKYDPVGQASYIKADLANLDSVILHQTFDANGNVTDVTANIGGTLTESTPNGIPTWSISYDGTYDFQNHYDYDHLGQLTQITQQTTPVGDPNQVANKRVTLTYDDEGRIDEIKRYNNLDLYSPQLVVTGAYAYDHDGRLTGLDYTHGATRLAGYQWQYDDAGRITAVKSYGDATAASRTSDPATWATATYSYFGNTDQLGGTTYSVNWQNAPTTDSSFTYDPTGNRTEGDYDHGVANRLSTDGTYNYSYDDEGNRTSRTKISDGTVTEYAWDHRNRLTSVTSKNSQGTVLEKVTYKYDVYDRWIGEDIDSDGDSDIDHETRFVYDGDNIALQFDKDVSSPTTLGAGDVSHRYLWNPQAVDQLFADEQVTTPGAAGNVVWPLIDNAGTVRDLATYSSGTTTVENHRVYDAFGQLKSESGATECLFGYTGRPFDNATKLQNNGHRWYEFGTGRWLNEDPLGFGGGDVNLSRYCNNSPTNYVDPSGLSGYVWYGGGSDRGNAGGGAVGNETVYGGSGGSGGSYAVNIYGSFGGRAGSFGGPVEHTPLDDVMRPMNARPMTARDIQWNAPGEKMIGWDGTQFVWTLLPDGTYGWVQKGATFRTTRDGRWQIRNPDGSVINTGNMLDPRTEAAERWKEIQRNANGDSRMEQLATLERWIASARRSGKNELANELQAILDKERRKGVQVAPSSKQQRAFKVPKSKLSGKEGAKDVPSWAKGKRPYVDENGNQFAKRLLDEKYGPGKYNTGPGSEFNEIKKWGDRAFRCPDPE
jgi:RHS repeat-associated protein